MADLPLVTVVTPSLNQGRFIHETIESVLAQDYPNIEYLVIDGGSTDETLSILRVFGGALSWVSEPDRGQSHALNKGLRRARGEILSWLNADDLLQPAGVSTAVAAFQDNPGLGLVYGDGYVVDADGYPLSDALLPDPNPWALINIRNYLLQPAAFFRRTAFREVGYLDECLRWTMDYDLFIRLMLRYPSAHLQQPLATERYHSQSKTATGGIPRLREIASVVRRYSTRRCPPALLYYGLDTASKLLEREVSSPAELSFVVTRAIDHLLHRAQDRISNRWARGYA